MTEIETVSALRVALWEAGFRPIPVLNPVLGDKDSGKRPLGSAWQLEAQKSPPFCVISEAVAHALNTGVYAAGLRIVDFDLDDALLSTTCREIAYRLLGPAPIRERFGSSRFLLVYRAADGEPGSTSITGTAHTTEHACKIEVLGTGRQFVAFGSHWSGVDLIWSGGTPGEVSIHDLPVVSEPQLHRFLEACASVIGAKSPGATRTQRVTPGGNGQAGDHGDHGDLFADPIRIIAALDGIANNEPADWEWWNRVGMAVWGATQGSAEGWAAWNQWSARNPAYHAARTRARWDHYSTSPPDRIGAGTLFHLAAQGGRASSLFGDMNDMNDMSPMSSPPPPRAGAREQQQNGEDPAGTTWEGDTAEEGEEAPPPSGGLDLLISQFNKKYAVAVDGGKPGVFWTVTEPILKHDELVRAGFDDFRKMFNNRSLTIYRVSAGQRRGITKTYAQWWLGSERRRQYLDGIVFDPSNKAGPGFMNLWRDWPVTPAEGDWSLMSTHIHEVICGGRSEISSYVLRWLAHMLQHPGTPAEVAIVMRGEKGVGKGAFGTAILKLCGQHGLHIINAAHLTGTFSGHLRNVIFVFADEALFAGDKKHEGVLKGIVTEGTILIEPKYRAPFMATNVLHLLMSSNNDWVIPASHDERRYLMLDVANTHRKDAAYFTALRQQMEAGGLAAMMHDLLAINLGDWHPRQVPLTAELADQVAHSRTSQEQWWHAVLERGYVWQSRYGHKDFLEWQPFVTRALLMKSYNQWCQENRIHYPAKANEVYAMLEKAYQAERHREPHIIYEVDSHDGNESPAIRKEWQRGYQTGTVEVARELFGANQDEKTEPSRF